MSFDFHQARPLLQKGDLSKLFVELMGWEPCRQKLTLRVNETAYDFTAVAEKRGFTVWHCAGADGRLPDNATRLKLDRALTQTSFEHLVVFAPSDFSKQSWMWVRREPGRPLSAKTHDFRSGQPGDSLLQKLQNLYVSLEEEEKGEISTLEMAGRARAAFDIERVTKAFYRDFDTHRKAFLKFIEGIGEIADREWYASVMLNRLMFVYFIQRKGFLDGDPAYLRNRLQRCQEAKGKDKFYTFYRYFLLRLFHEGFGKRRKDRAADLEKLLGNIPYLNGGLFDVHELEKPDRYGDDIRIKDEAFEQVFDYFDKYQWHLDERPLRKDDEINPDVLGYIFEKYINQKQMGAYYTKEDITEYISKNSVLPFIFDAARARCGVAFQNRTGPTVWDIVRENPDRYIYSALRHGITHKLPPEISDGLKASKPGLIERRKAWSKQAPAEFALPTEIWREVVGRRQRYEEVRRKIEDGAIRDVKDFVTLNLDLRQFSQDVIKHCEGPDLLMAFWEAISTITVLDPTGGSGAFIFSALSILEPLYEACLERMEGFLSDWGNSGGKGHPDYATKFAELLANVDADVHPNRRYFVLKSIILNNLYAVDIMEEATEICKLRLFLKLAAQVAPDPTRDNLGIEPLPDIDFNIRAGNSLVGYATAAEVRKCMKEWGGGQMKLMDEGDLDSFTRFNSRCSEVEEAFTDFRRSQTAGDGAVPYADKRELQKRLRVLEEELNLHLAGECGVKTADKAALTKWVKSHQPFHWFIHFYGIISRGGFDVIIGNPPYVEMSKVKEYRTRNYTTDNAGNLYALCVERSGTLLSESGYLGVIVPLSGFSTERMSSYQEYVWNRFSFLAVSFYSGDAHPCVLFEGVKYRLCIIIGNATRDQDRAVHVSDYLRWYADERPNLFAVKVSYAKCPFDTGFLRFAKTGTDLSLSVTSKILAQKPTMSLYTRKSGKGHITYHRSPVFWIRSMNFEPYFKSPVKDRSTDHLKDLFFPNSDVAEKAGAIINSTLFYFWFSVQGNCRNIAGPDIENFPVGDLADPKLKKVIENFDELMTDLKRHSKRRVYVYEKSGKVEYDEFYPDQSKTIIDRIDEQLASHYGFTEEELDFVLEYDGKYRMGRDAGTEEEEE